MKSTVREFLACAFLTVTAIHADAAQVSLHLPLARTAYQCNEQISVTVARSDAKPLAEGDVVLKLNGDDGSRLEFTFPVGKAGVESGSARSVEHLQVNGWLLRPGGYTIEAACDGASAATNITVHSHLRQSSFKLINWGRAKGRDQLAQGERNLGFNLLYGNYAADEEANCVRAGVDFMACCVMSGGHQMDLRQECDWSDPYVMRGGTRRVVQRAFIDRTRPNVWGVHFYDEPGLTWAKDPETGEMTPHAVPWQLRQYEAAFGEPMLNWKQLDPNDPAQVARWAAWARWKLGLMDAAWQDAQFGVGRVRPDYVSVTQSQYGYAAFTDGYYCNVVRSLPIISGHGGYHDWGPGYFNPSMFLEFARARDLARPNWYLPTWYGNTTPDEFRVEQYLSFQCNIQGLISPPDLEPAQPAKSPAAQGIVESNHLLGRLGTIFTTMPVTRPPVALLFSLSQMIHAQTLDRKANYAHDTPSGRNLPFAYLAGKLLQHQFMPVLDEEVLDGTLAAQHRAVVLTSVDYLDAGVVAALENFAKAGGLVLLTGDCTVKLDGAVKLPVKPELPEAARIAALKAAGKATEANELARMRHQLIGAQKLADAIRPHLERAGIHPPLASSEPGIVVTRQAAGDVEYLLAVNATHDPAGNPMLGLKAVTAGLGLVDDGRPVYDAVHSRPAREFTKDGSRLRAECRFGPGQLRVFARTARPIGGVKTGTPMVRRDHALPDSPLRVDVAAVVLDSAGGLLSGAIPLRLRLIDALGVTRHDLYRATDRGSLNLSLPLAINDPPGSWKFTVTELLSGTEAGADFQLEATTICPTAGSTWRAVFWPDDRERVFRFFRTHHTVTIVTGSAAFHAAAATRLERILKPWNLTCSRITAAEVNKPRSLTDEEAATWVGLDFASRGQIKPGDRNSPALAGFAIEGPAILLGTPDDNPLIKFLAERRFLPYQPNKTLMPGPGRGYVAWQREGLGVNQESITLIAYDDAGLKEAIGTLDEMLAGLAPLTPLAPPRANVITAANRSAAVPEPAIDWSVVLPDRITALKADAQKLVALTHAGVQAELETDGRIASQRILQGADYQKSLRELTQPTDPAALAKFQKAAPPTRLVKLIAANGRRTAVVCWGGTVNIFDVSGVLKSSLSLPQDITAMAWSGSRLIVGDADGAVRALIER